MGHCRNESRAKIGITKTKIDEIEIIKTSGNL